MAQNESVTTIKVRYDGKEAERGLQSLSRLFKGFIGYEAVKKIGDYFLKASDAAKELINAEAKLKTAVGGTSTVLLQQSEALQKSSTYRKEDIISAQAMLMSYIKSIKKTQEAMPVIMDLATMIGQELPDAALLFGKAFSSLPSALSRYGIVGLGAVGTMERFNSLLVSAKYYTEGYYKSLAATPAGKLMQSENLLRSQAQIIGKEIIPVQTEWNKLILWLVRDLAKTATWISTIKRWLTGTSADVIQMEANIAMAFTKPAEEGIKYLQDYKKELAKSLGITPGKDMDKQFEKIKSSYESVTDTAKKFDILKNKFNLGYVAIPEAEIKKTKDLIKQYDMLSDALKSMKGEFKPPPTPPPGADAEKNAQKLAQLQAEALRSTHEGRLKAIEIEKEAELTANRDIAGAAEAIEKIYFNKREAEMLKYIKAETEMYIEGLEETYANKVASLEVQKELEIKEAENTGVSRLLIEAKYAKLIDSERRKINTASTDKRRDQAKREEDMFKRMEQLQLGVLDEYTQKKKVIEKQYLEDQLMFGADNLAARKNYEKSLAQLSFDRIQEVAGREMQAAGELNGALQSLTDAQTQREIRHLDKKHMSQKKYDKAVEAIEKRGQERQKKYFRMEQVLIAGQTAMRIAEAIAGAMKLPPPWNFIEAAIIAGVGTTQIATIQAQHFQRGFLGEASRGRQPDNMSAMIGRNEAVIPGPQYSMHEEDVRAIVNNTANTAAGLRRLHGGQVVNNFYGVATDEVIAIQRDSERRRFTGRLI